jgi:hypothetical protein
MDDRIRRPGGSPDPEGNREGHVITQFFQGGNIREARVAFFRADRQDTELARLIERRPLCSFADREIQMPAQNPRD